MREKKNSLQKIINTCLLSGQIMIESGSEMYRVEDTVVRIAKNAGLKNVSVFTTPTVIAIGLDGVASFQLRQVKTRSINLEKVSRVNDLSRRFAEGRINLNSFNEQLLLINDNTEAFPDWLQAVGAAIVSCALMIIFTGEYDWIDFPISAFIGALGYMIYLFINEKTKVKFMAEMIAAIVIAISTLLSVKVGLGKNIDNIIIGAIMPLVPGVPLTNSMRDLLESHLISGIARGVEAILSAMAIGLGIAAILKLFL